MRWQRPLALVAAVAAVAGLVTIGPRLDELRPSTRRADLGVVMPPAPDVPTPPRVTAPPAPSVPVHCRSGTACLRWRLPPIVPGSGSPALAAGHLVMPTATGLLGYLTATGEQRWRTDLDVPNVAGPTVVAVAGASRYVVVADRRERLAAVDAADGTVRWQQMLPGLGAARAAHVGADGWLVATRFRGDDELTSFVAVLAVDDATGRPQWRREAANAALSPAGAVLQDVNGTLTGLAPDGTDAWELVTGTPSASLTPVGDLLLVGARDLALLVDTATGEVLEEIVGPPSQIRADAGAVVWPVAGGIGYRSAGAGWRATVPEAAGCCSGFVVDTTTVTVLTGRGEMIRLAVDDGRLLDRRPAPSQFAAGDGRAWLYGDIALAAVPRSGGMARLHDTHSGDHLADITSEAYALLAADDDTAVVLAPGFALTLAPSGGAAHAEGRPVGSARAR
jgi:outer membrane protein assembly factor BamB